MPSLVPRLARAVGDDLLLTVIHTASHSICENYPITQEIILHAYRAVPDVFYRLYSSLINIGYHPTCWRQATGAF
jgi:hypothetical protein